MNDVGLFALDFNQLPRINNLTKDSILKTRLALWVVPVLCIRKRAKKVFEMHLVVSPLELPMAHCKLNHNQKSERFSLKLVFPS